MQYARTVRVAITGGTGLVGQRLGQLLRDRGDEVTVISRREGPGVIPWDVREGVQPKDALSGFDAVVHLAGAAVAERRWTAARKREIMDSRRDGTRAVVAALAAADPRPSVLVCASAVGYYGDTGSEIVTESSPSGDDFLADVCCAWESEADAAASIGVRVVKARIGLVLALEGGALGRMLPIFRVGGGGRLGSGRQWMPWIHIDDVVAGLVHTMDCTDCDGAYNLTAPEPVDNREFTRALGQVLRRPAVVPVPGFALRLAFGELAGALLAGQRALPRRLLREGFSFRHSTLPAALNDLVA